MNRAGEIKERAKALRAEKADLQAKLAAARGREAADLRLKLAAVEEDLVDCARLLRELMPQHRISRGRTWSGLEGWQWDKLQYQTWAELEGSEDPEGPTEQDKMRLAVRTARAGLTPTQEAYLAQTDGGKRPAQVAREAGKHRSTVCRTLQRGKDRIAEDARVFYDLLSRREGGPLVVDLGEPQVLKAVLDRLTQRQQTYLYLYYGEWLSLREIGALLGVDHASVLRSIRCGLRRMESLALGEQVEVRGLDSLEERLMAHFNDLPLEEETREKRTYQKRGKTIPKPAPIHLKDLLLRFVRDGRVRTAGAVGPELEVQPGGWSSGVLLAWLEDRVSGRQDRKSLLRRLLYRLFTWIRRDLDVDHH
ncbi:hypothetical protein B5G34_01265 [Flavonifractor sp. An82]|uniref:sigma factor-like helix-turn-helix DNA-binding protein n=1 Tax=Flavonifractor sp. An82 TaxID=1965660 RepID=UPI000B372F38|nr:sigma factor-like helix-turn-helix DNA-binding protein [Flavonifractor sp. An82]OUN23747.1 hypothetical protein B5G34_01265 [Flavonifractor sp. An82]